MLQAAGCRQRRLSSSRSYDYVPLCAHHSETHTVRDQSRPQKNQHILCQFWNLSLLLASICYLGNLPHRDHILNSRPIRSFVWVRSVRLGVQ